MQSIPSLRQVCAWCQRPINQRDLVREGAKLSHGICPECIEDAKAGKGHPEYIAVVLPQEQARALTEAKDLFAEREGLRLLPPTSTAFLTVLVHNLLAGDLDNLAQQVLDHVKALRETGEAAA